MSEEEQAEPEDPHNNHGGQPGYADLPEQQCQDEEEEP